MNLHNFQNQNPKVSYPSIATLSRVLMFVMLGLQIARSLKL